MDLVFTGQYESVVDAKGRITLPVKLLNEISPIVNEGFVIKYHKLRPCLELFPKKVWDDRVRTLFDVYDTSNEEEYAYLTAEMEGNRPIELQGGKRLLITKDLIERVGIGKNIIVRGLVNYLEIWADENYADTILSTEQYKQSTKKYGLRGPR